MAVQSRSHDPVRLNPDRGDKILDGYVRKMSMLSLNEQVQNQTSIVM